MKRRTWDLICGITSQYMICYMSTMQIESPSLVIFEIIPERKAHMTFDPWFKVKYHGTKQKPIYDFLYAYNTSGASISHSFLDIWEKSPFESVSLVVFEKTADFTWKLWTLTFRGQTPTLIPTIFNKLWEGIIGDMWSEDEIPALKNCRR